MTLPQAPSERDSRTRWLKIAAAFEAKYAKPLRSMLKAECSGD